MDEVDQSNYVLALTERALKPENISAGQCFLCGCTPTKGKGEHIFPKWLQNRFNLWDNKLGLLNSTLTPYRNVRVPACQSCNSEILARTEKFVCNISEKNIAHWTPECSFEVGRWIAKILLGILFLESRLDLDRSDPGCGSIFPPDSVDEYFLLHLLVQSWRKAPKFSTLHTTHPFTLYVYEIDDDENHSKFNFSTNLSGKSVCIRLGKIAFAFVGDGGLQHHAANLGPYNLGFQKLHPIQFDEISARVHYKSTLRDATHFYVNSESPEEFYFEQIRVVPYSQQKLPSGESRIFKEWSNDQFSKFLENYQVPGWRDLLDTQGVASYTRLVDQFGEKIVLR